MNLVLRVLCVLTFGHWRRVKVYDYERNTTYKTYCWKCREVLEWRQVFDKEPWRSMLQNAEWFIPTAGGGKVRLP